jgi:hypothetical protein
VTASDRDVLHRATALLPALRRRAARTEQLRRLPPETVKDLVAAGLVRIGTPRRYGGNGLDIDAGHAVAWELGRACGSTAWCCSLWIVHNWWLGHFPERAQDEFFSSGPDTLASTCLNPAGGVATPDGDGFRVSGRWSFSSGCEDLLRRADHARHLRDVLPLHRLPIAVAALVCAAVVGVLGVLLHLLVIAHLLGAAPINQLLATGGVLFFLQSAATVLLASSSRTSGFACRC